MSRFWRLGTGIGSIGVVAALWLVPGGAAASASLRSGASDQAVPRAALTSISGYLGRSDAAYWARRNSRSWSVPHRLGGYAVGYSTAGARLTAAGGAWLRFAAPRGGAEPTVSRNRVTYRSGSESEWFADGPAGLEQGFTLTSPPRTGARGGEVTLPVRTAGTLRAVRRSGSIRFIGTGGTPALFYGGLSVTDAHGRDLKASLTLSGGRLQIKLDAAHAAYPITVDPTITTVLSEATLVDAAGDQTADSELGTSVAIDGSTIVVGEPYGANCGEGAGGQVDIFTEPAGGWSGTLTPAAVLGNPQDEETSDCDGGTAFHFGDAVAIATVGSTQTIVVGDPDNSDTDGAAYVYDEPGAGWGSLASPDYDFTQQLSSADEEQEAQGSSVAIDSNTIAVGNIESSATGADPEAGTVDLYQLSGGQWQQEATLSAEASGNLDEDAEIGTSVALANASYGTVVVSGAPDLFDPEGCGGDGCPTGGALVWVEPNGGWESAGGNNGTVAQAILPGTFLSDSRSNDYAESGLSVAIDPTGSPIAVGEPYATHSGVDAGDVLVYAAPGGSDGWAGAASEVGYDAELLPAAPAADELFGSGLGIAGGTVYSSEVEFDSGTSVFDNGAVLEYPTPQGGWADHGVVGGEGTDLIATGADSTGSPSSVTGPGSSGAVAVDPGTATVVAGATLLTPASDYGGALVWPASATATPPPTPVAAPTGTVSVSGTAAAGETLTCHANDWTGSPTLSYAWTLNGQPIPGATGTTLTLDKADADGTIVCEVTGKNSGGSKTVDSSPVHVGVCVVATGSMHGDVLGPVHLGEGANAVLGLFPKQNQTHYGTQRFCVVGGDERVEFPTQKLLRSLKAALRERLKQRVVMELTANPVYSVDGVRHGISVASARHKLKLGPAYRIGANTWYLIRGHGDDILIKTEGGIVREIGYIDARLIASGGLVRFFSTFLNSGISL